jgi:hypothetical protein
LALFALQATLIAGTWTNQLATSYFWRPAALVQALSGLVFLVVGLLILRRRPGNSIGSHMTGIGVGILGYGAAAEYATYGLLAFPGSLPLAGVFGVLSQTLWIVPFALIPIMFLVFPTGRFLSRWWKVPAFLAASAMAVVVIVGTIDSWKFRNSGGETILLVDELSPTVDFALNTGVNLLITALVLSVVSLFVRWRRGTPVVRLQLKWLLLVGLVLLTQGILILVDTAGSLSVLNDALLLIGLLGLPIAVGIAVTRYRLYDIERIISRTVSYGSLTVLLVALYLGSVFLLRSLLPVEGQLPVAITTLALAALFNPVRRSIQRWVDRRFNRSRYDTEVALNDFSERLRNQADLRFLGDEITGVVERTMQPASVALWVR